MISKRKRHTHKERSHHKKRKVDLISQLPDDLLHKILLNLTTKESIRTSVLANRWRHVWKHVPCLDINYTDFQNIGLKDISTMTSFLSRFKLDFPSQEYTFKLTNLLNSVALHGIQHLVVNNHVLSYTTATLPVSIGRCETLVHLELHNVALPSFELVSLPRLETMHLSDVVFPSDTILQKLISSSKILRVLSIKGVKNVEVLQVWSQTLNKLIISVLKTDQIISGMVIDAPRLKSLHIDTTKFLDIVINGSCAPKKMIISFLSSGIDKDNSCLNNLLAWIFNVTRLNVNCSILKAMNANSGSLHRFHNLTYLQLTSDYCYFSLMFLGDCLNLKSLHLSIGNLLNVLEIPRSPIPTCLRSSLEFVEISTTKHSKSIIFTLPEYFLGNAAVLKELTIHLPQVPAKMMLRNVNQILKFPRLSSPCQVIVL